MRRIEMEIQANLLNHKVGAYCLANDNVIEWFEAFIRSFRKNNPMLPLTVIPYDKSVLRLNLLKEPFNFTVMDESECSRFDSLAIKTGAGTRGVGTFRKYACFFAQFNPFIFLDSDIVVLSSLDYIFEAFTNSGCDLLYFDSDMTMVYKPAFALKMIALHGSQGFNNGVFVSHKKAISEAELFSIAERASGLKDNFITDCLDQPFFNYVFDVSRRRVAHVTEVLPDIAISAWARAAFHYERKSDMATNNHGKTMPLIHWAGCSYPSMVRKELFLRWRTADLSFVGRCYFRIKFYCSRWRIALARPFKKWRARFLTLPRDKAAWSRHIRKQQRRFHLE